MNANALAVVSPTATSASSLPTSVANQAAANADDSAFSKALAQQSEAHQPASTTGAKTANDQSSTSDAAHTTPHRDNKATKEKGDDALRNAHENQRDPIVSAALFIASESAGIRQALKLDGQQTPGQGSTNTKNSAVTALQADNVRVQHDSDVRLKPDVTAEHRLSISVVTAAAQQLARGVSTDDTAALGALAQHQLGGTSTHQSAQNSQGARATFAKGQALSNNISHQPLGANAQRFEATDVADLATRTMNDIRVSGFQVDAHHGNATSSFDPASSLNLGTAFVGHSVASTAHATPLPLSASVNVPLHHAQWGSEFGRQIVSFTQGAPNGVHQAELRLDPPELGPIRISLKLSDSIAQAYIVSPHASVRSAIEQALPQLQQALAQAGLSLGQADVSDQGSAQHFEQHANPQAKPGQSQSFASVLGTPDASTTAADAVVQSRSSNPDALVDTFA